MNSLNMVDHYRMCRVCLKPGKDDELKQIFDAESHTAIEIFLVSSVKIIEFSDHRVPALICHICLQQLADSISFREKCIKGDEHFKRKISEIVATVWKSSKDDICVKQEQDSDNIKQEPLEEFNLDLFNIDTILEDNVETNNFEGCAKTDSSSESGCDERRERKQKARRNKRAQGFKESDFGVIDGIASCHLCFKSFTSMHSMNDHMRAIHEKLDEADMYKCPYCSRLFKMRYYLNRHIKTNHLGQVRKKSNNKAKQKPKQEVDAIFKEKLPGLNCPYCNKFLTSKHSLNDHIRVKHEFIDYSERYCCDICGRQFPIKYYCLRHIKSFHLKTMRNKKKPDESLPCSICGKVLKSKGSLSTHEKTHRILSPDEYWYCDVCGCKFKSKGEMSIHIKHRHVEKIRYPCELCPGKSWRTLFQMQRHVKVFHNNIREFKCEWCGKEFGEKNKLQCHVRIHTGEQPFACKFCDRKFTHATDLRRHTWGHTGERPYRCSPCGKGFMKKSELVSHEGRCHPAARPPIPYQYQM